MNTTAHTATRTACTYDSGSATGCAPACTAAATHVVSYTVPCYGHHQVIVCRRHILPTQGRAGLPTTVTQL